MATRFKATDLQEMIRKIVREEMTGVVKEAINEVLSERYLKQLAEASASRPRGVGPTLPVADGDDLEEEPAPRPLSNPTQGIYRQHPMKHDDNVDDEDIGELQLTPEGRQRDEMLSLFFEGTKPLAQIEAEAPIVDDVPLNKLEQNNVGRPITEVWKTLAGMSATKREKTTTLPSDLEKREEMRLKMLRESLERPAGTANG